MLERCPPEFVQSLYDVAGVLVLAHAPLTSEIIWTALNLNSSGWDFALRHLSEYLTAIHDEEGGVQETFYRIYHESFAAYLRAKTTPDHARLLGRLADYCRTWDEKPEGYGLSYSLRFGPTHQLEAKRSEDAVGLLTDWRFLEAKTEAGLVYGLVTDFGKTLATLPKDHAWFRRLELLHEALRREVNFLHRRPTCLFQQMWNLCWWYDHPDAAKHYDLTKRTNTGPLPWERDDPKLHVLLEEWRRNKEAESAFVWLRSHRPPTTQLGTHLKGVFIGHEKAIRSVAWSRDGRFLVSGSKDQTVRVWDAATGEERLCLFGHQDSVESVSWSRDGRYLASASWDKTIRVWDAATGEERLCLFGHRKWVSSVSWSPSGRFLASGSDDKTVRVWDTTTGEERLCLRGHEQPVMSVVWSPDEHFLASGAVDKTVRVWDTTTGEERLCLCGHEGTVKTLAWSESGNFLASGSWDETVRVWDATTGEVQLCLRGHDKVNCLAWSADGRFLANGSDDKTVRVWDVTTGEERLYLRGHEQWVLCLAWSADGRFLASGSDDKTVRVWDVTTGEDRLHLCGHKELVNSVGLSVDGLLLASGSVDKTVRVWDTTTGERVQPHRDSSFRHVIGKLNGEGAEKVLLSTSGHETVLSTHNGEAFAWVPPLRHTGIVINTNTITTSNKTGRSGFTVHAAIPRSTQRLCGAIGNDVMLYTIEGKLPLPSSGTLPSTDG